MNKMTDEKLYSEREAREMDEQMGKIRRQNLQLGIANETAWGLDFDKRAGQIEGKMARLNIPDDKYRRVN